MALFFSFALGLVESLPPPNYTEQIQQEQNTLENAGQRSMPWETLKMRFVSVEYLESD